MEQKWVENAIGEAGLAKKELLAAVLRTLLDRTFGAGCVEFATFRRHAIITSIIMARVDHKNGAKQSLFQNMPFRSCLGDFFGGGGFAK